MQLRKRWEYSHASTAALNFVAVTTANTMSVIWGAGLHAPVGKRVDGLAYAQYIGRWSRLFVPALLDAGDVCDGDRVLDVATGTGEAAALALPRVGSSGLVVGSDISAAMLDEACARLSNARFLPVVADGQALVFPDATFDAVLCQLGLMFFPDPARGLAEFRRVLRPGRRAAVCVISLASRAPMWGVLAETLSGHLPQHQDTLRLSFSLGDVARLEGLFGAARFRDTRVTRETRQDVVSSFDEYWAPIELGTGSLPQAYLALPEPTRHAVRDQVHERLAQFESDGRLEMSVEMLIASGRA
jgi:SAM-dependent methyltransferase